MGDIRAVNRGKTRDRIWREYGRAGFRISRRSGKLILRKSVLRAELRKARAAGDEVWVRRFQYALNSGRRWGR